MHGPTNVKKRCIKFSENAVHYHCLNEGKLSQKTKNGLWTQHGHSNTPACDRQEKTQNSQCRFLHTGLMVTVCYENHTTHITAL